MSEEDIIEEIKEWLNHETNFENLPEYDARNLYITVKGLLDLYNKEKEKNRILEDLLQGNLYELYLYYKELAGSYQANSISKDKIKEMIKEKENRIDKMHPASDCVIIDDLENQIEVLKELLEE